MRDRCRYRRRLVHRRAGLVLLLPLLLGSGLIGAPGGGGGGGGTGDITDVFSCSTGDCNNVTVQSGEVLNFSGTGTITASDLTCTACLNDAELASDYSGVGVCTATKFVTTLTRNAAPTCTQPTIGDLVAFSSSQLATALTDETGTAGSAVFSAAPTFTGSVKVAGDGANLTFDPDSTGAQSFVTFTDGTETISNVWLLANVASGTFTLNNSLSAVAGFTLSTAVIFDMTTAPSFAQNFFNQAAQYRMSVAGTTPLIRPFVAQSTYNANNVAWTMSNDSADYTSIPTFSITGGGTFVSAARMGFYGKATVSGGTVNQYRGFVFDDATGAGAVTTQIAVDIAALSKGASNMGIRNADTTVFSSGATQSIASGGATTIACSATFIEIDYPTGGAVTVSNNPTIPDSNDGQICLIVNVDSADTITLRDEAVSAGSNLRLPGAVNLALGPRDTLTIMYSSALADWITLATANN